MVLSRLIRQLESVGGKASEEIWIENEIRRLLSEGYCVFRVDHQEPGDYSSVRHGSDEAGYNPDKSVKYVKERYPDAMVANDDPEAFIKYMQRTGVNHFLFEGKNPARAVRDIHEWFPRKKKSPPVTEVS